MLRSLITSLIGLSLVSSFLMTLVIIIMLRLRKSFSICYCLMILAYLMKSMVNFSVTGDTSASRLVTSRWRFTLPDARRWSVWCGPLYVTWMQMSRSRFTHFRRCHPRIRYFLLNCELQSSGSSSLFYVLVLINKSFWVVYPRYLWSFSISSYCRVLGSAESV